MASPGASIATLIRDTPLARQSTLLDGEGWLAAEEADAVLAAVVVDGGGIDGLEAGELRQFPKDVEAAAAARGAIDLLDGDDIGAVGVDDGSHTAEVALTVHADAVADVVGHEAGGLLAGRAGRKAEEEGEDSE